MNSTIIAIIVSLGLIIGAVILTRPSADISTNASTENVSVVEGTQYIDITAKGGYSPRRTEAKAGVPTILRVNTKGTFDCSIALRIPSLRYGKNLSPNETAEIDLGTPQAGALNGTCSMGMYNFTINFK